jgi:spore maturation protein CgeB
MMRLLIIGSDKIYAIENFYEKYIREPGTEVSLFPAQHFFYEYYNRSFVNKLIYRAGMARVIHKINEQLKETVKQVQPDVIWIFKGMEITPATLQSFREQNILLVNYNPDNPFIFTGSGSGNENVTKSIALYDLHFTYNLEIKKKLETDFHASTAFLPFGFDVTDKLYEECRRQEEINKVCFLGNPDKKRVATLRSLLDQGIAIDVYGNYWNKFIQHKNLTVHGPVYGDEFWNILHRYRIQLNLLRVHNEQSHNMRTFEVPGIGAIQLAPDTPEHRMFFEEGKEIFLFQDVASCCNQIRFLLNLSTTEANTIRENARQKSITSGYSYKDRAHYAFDTIQKLKSH